MEINQTQNSAFVSESTIQAPRFGSILKTASAFDSKEEIKSNNEAIELKDIMTAKELFNMNITAIPSLIEPIIPKTGLVALAGSSDSGKSTFLRQLAIAIVTGRNNFLGMPIKAEHKRVIYITTEDDQYAWSFLILKQLDPSANLELLDQLKVVFNAENYLQTIEMLLKEHKTDLVIVDAFGDIFNGEINSTGIVRPFLQKYYELCREYGCAIIFLHHTGKKAEDVPPSKRNLVGSQAFEAKMRVVLELRRDPVNPSIRHLCAVKGNYMADELKTKSIELSMDTSLIFSPTGNKVDFERIVKDQNSQKTQLRNARIVALGKEGKSSRQIAATLDIEGFDGSKSTVSKVLKDVQMSSPPSEDGRTEVTKE